MHAAEPTQLPGKLRVREVMAKSILNPSQISGVTYAINPYVGCQHGCAYCYARFVSRHTGHMGEEWGSFVDVKINAARVLQQQLRRRRQTVQGSVMFSSVTDAYQPLERRYGLTRACLELLRNHQIPVSILTKSDLVLRDADLLGEFKEADVGMTIITLDERVRRVFEAQAPPVSRRLAALSELSGRGLHVWGFVGPIIPYLSAPSLDELVRRLGEAGVSHIFFDRLNLKSGNWPVIRRALQTSFADQYAAIEAALHPGSPYYSELREQLEHVCQRHGVEFEVLF
jgi:DNA repair photolyase